MTLLFWLDSPVGIVALMILCGGDGLADVVAGNGAGPSCPGTRASSWAGSAAMFLACFAFALAYLALFARLGILDLSVAAGVAALGADLPGCDGGRGGVRPGHG